MPSLIPCLRAHAPVHGFGLRRCNRGVHRDTLIAYTPVGIRRLLIEGLATEPQLTVPATIRFQAAPLGIYRDTLVQWLACATIPQQVRIEPAGPDSIQFQLLTIRTITLPVDTPCTAYPFAFRAQRLGRSCLRLLIEGQEHQPYECVLIGDVVCAQPYSGSVLAAPQSISTQAGRVITVPIWMPSVPAEFRTMQRPFRFTVRCNASALLPEPPLERGTVVGGERRFSVTGRGFMRGIRWHCFASVRTGATHRLYKFGLRTSHGSMTAP